MQASFCRMFWILVTIVVSIACPHLATAIGEYNGMWAGEQKMYITGYPPETGYTVVVIYQTKETEIFISDDVVESIRLVRSGNQWVLPEPIHTRYKGLFDMTLEYLTVSFLSTTQLSGELRMSIDVGGKSIDAKATILQTKQTCSTLSSGVPVRNLSGNFDYDLYFQIDVPEGAAKLNVKTSGGNGNADLMVFYSRPDFKTVKSGDNDNNENISIPAPQAGRWYISHIPENICKGQ
jgi:hypothetical protein